MKSKATVAMTVLLTSVSAFAVYDSSEGRWTSRDPIEEEGGVNLYAFCRNNPVNNVDYLGMWKIKREGEAWAIATAEEGDTFDSLGTAIQLDTSDYKIWAHTQDDTPELCKEYKIPNTVYYHHGKFKILDCISLPVVLHDSNVFSYHSDKGKGFNVKWVDANVSDATITSALADEYLYDYFYAGHGGNGSINTYGNDGVAPSRYTKYGIRFLVLESCESASKSILNGKAAGFVYNQWEWNVANRGKFYGYAEETSLGNKNRQIRVTPGTNRSFK